jgi:hypothetical protein
MCVTYFTICQTDFVLESSVKYDIGYIMISILGGNIAVLLVPLTLGSFKKVKLNIKRFFMLREAEHIRKNILKNYTILQQQVIIQAGQKGIEIEEEIELRAQAKIKMYRKHFMHLP